MSTLAMQVEVAIFLAVEVDAPLHQFLDLFRSHAHYLLYGLWVADVVASYHGVLDVFVEVVYLEIGH